MSRFCFLSSFVLTAMLASSITGQTDTGNGAVDYSPPAREQLSGEETGQTADSSSAVKRMPSPDVKGGNVQAVSASAPITGTRSPVDSTRINDRRGLEVTSKELDKIVVRAQYKKAIASEVIDSESVAEPRDSKTVEGLLSNLAGIDLKRSSPAAAKGTGVQIRGFDESRSLILLNGRPLNGAGVMGGEYVDWSMLPTTDVTEVEVIRGVKSAEYGNTIGGVINIITKRNMKAPTSTKVNASYGIVSPEHADDGLDRRSTDVSVVQHTNILNIAALDLFGAVGHQEPYLRNNYFDRLSYGGECTMVLPLEMKASVGFLHTDYTRGFAILNNPDSSNWDPDYPQSLENGGGGPPLSWRGGRLYYGDRSYWRDKRTQIDVSLQKIFPTIVLTALGHLNDQDRTEYFYAVTDTNKLVLERFAKPEDYTWGANLLAKQTIRETILLKYGAEGTSMRYSNADIRACDTSYFRTKPVDGDLSQSVRAADRWGVFVQSYLSFVDRYEIKPGIRYDYYISVKRDSTVPEKTLQGVSPNAEISAVLWKGGKATLQGAYAYRFPTCPELYWYYGGYRPADRKELSPERAAQAELGLFQTIMASENLSGAIEIRGYDYFVYDYIRTIFGYQPSRLVYNIDKAMLAGVECEASLKLWKSISLRANYTFQTTEKSGDSFDSSMVITKGLPELPKNKANFNVEYAITNGARAGLAMRYVGQRDVITGNLARGNASQLRHVDGFTTFRLYGAYPLWKKERCAATFKAGIDNLFDVKYEEIAGLPMPGITGTANVEVTF